MASTRISFASFLTLFSFLFYTVTAQLSGSVGPTTSTASKAAKKICNVLNYGAKADQKTDLGPPLTSAFNDCKSGGIGRLKANPPYLPSLILYSMDPKWELCHGYLGNS